MRSRAFVVLALSLSLSVASFAHAQDGAATPPAAAPAPPADVNEAVTRVQRFYDSTTSFQSDFVQEFLIKAYNTKKSSAGTVTFQKPGKMDWVYTTPKDNRVVSDGSELKVYDAANKQLFQQQVNKSQYPAALAFLTGQGKLSDHFDFELQPGEKMNFPGGYVLVGTPKVPHPAYTKVFFYIDGLTSQARRVLILDGQGNRNRFDFTAPKVNIKVPATQFDFKAPPNTMIVRP
jgi:outer membrane lipoprotein carrier protein